MKNAIKILSILIFSLFFSVAIAQTDPPPPDDDPNNGGTELGGNAPIGSGLISLLLFASAYAVGRTYRLRTKEKK